MDSNKLFEILFCIISINKALSKRGICSYKISRMFSMSNEDIIIDERTHPINRSYVPNQTKLMIICKVNKISN